MKKTHVKRKHSSEEHEQLKKARTFQRKCYAKTKKTRV